MGPGFLVVNVIVNYCCTRVLLYAKMLKENENEKTRLFCHILIFDGISIGGGGERAPWAPLLTMPMIVTLMLFYDIKILCAFLLVCPCVPIKATLMVLFCMIMLSM